MLSITSPFNSLRYSQVVGDLEGIIKADQAKRERQKIQRMSTYKVLHSEKEVDMLKGAGRELFKPKALNKSSTFGRDSSVHGTFALIKGKVPIFYGVEVFNKSGVKEAGTATSYERGRKLLSSFEKQSTFLPILLATFQTEKCCYRYEERSDEMRGRIMASIASVRLAFLQRH